MNGLNPRVPVDLEQMITKQLEGWVPPRLTFADAEVLAAELNETLGSTDQEDGYTGETVWGWWWDADVDDDERRRRLAMAIVRDVRDVMELPSARSWRRWPITAKVASWLYVSGLTRAGLVSSSAGIDPTPSPRHTVYMLPKWRHVLPSKYGRPYILGVPRWKRDCWKIQLGSWWHGDLVRWHRPGPEAYGFCGSCVPCHDCGVAEEHEDSATGCHA